jgi:class 3 adenylate cyclase
MQCARCGREASDESQHGDCVVAPDDAPASDPQAGSRSERRQLTVLFCDLVGSTALSERMDPDDLRVVLRDFHHRCTAIVRRFHGHVAQYLGDGLLVYFGYPLAGEDAPVRAVDAALVLVSSMANTSSETPWPETLRVRVGIHTGPVVVGDMGDVLRPERLAVGATPNLAARVQAQADVDSVFLSEATHALVEPYFDCEALGARKLRGISQPMALYRVLGRATATSAITAAEQRGFSRFTGREAELDQLTIRWSQREVDGSAVLIVGEAGLGKSRLVHELSRRLPSHEVVLLAASEYHQSQALFPVTQYLEQWAQLSTKDTPDERRDRLASRLAEIGQEKAQAEIASLLSLELEAPKSTQVQPSTRQHDLVIQKLADFFAAVARHAPILFVVEDLHWADASTHQFLKVWLDRRKAVPALTIATVRTGFVPAWAEESGFEVLPLNRLSREAARSVARDVVERLAASPPEDLLDQVLDRAEGVPLFIEEITRSLAELASAPSASASDLDPPSLRVPASLADSLMARLDRLGSAKWVAQLAAVIGREAPFAWLEELFSSSPGVLRLELARVAAAGILSERAGAEPTYVFAHSLVRESAYQSLSKRPREELHQRVADMLATRYPDVVAKQPLLLAHHYTAAGMTANAVRYLRDAGHRSVATSAFVEAVDVFNRALSLLPSIEPSRERDALEIELLSSVGLALIPTQGYTSASVEDVYARARRLCERSGDVPLRVLFGVWAVHLVRADARGVGRMSTLFQRLVETSQDGDGLLIAHSCLGVRAFYRMDLDAARHHLLLASAQLNLADPRTQHEKMLDSYGFDAILSGPIWLAWVETLQGNEEEARRQMQTAAELAERIGDPYLKCMVAAYSGTIAREWHDLAPARELVARVASLSADHDLLFWRTLGLCVEGWVKLQDHDAAAAIALVREALATLDAIGSLVNRAYFLSYYVEACLSAGELEEGLRAADEALSMCRESLGPMYEPELMRLKGALLVASGDEGMALEHFRAALAQSRLSGVRLLEVRAAASLALLLGKQGKLLEARDTLETTCRAWPESSVCHDIRTAREALAELTSVPVAPAS